MRPCWHLICEVVQDLTLPVLACSDLRSLALTLRRILKRGVLQLKLSARRRFLALVGSPWMSRWRQCAGGGRADEAADSADACSLVEASPSSRSKCKEQDMTCVSSAQARLGSGCW